MAVFIVLLTVIALGIWLARLAHTDGGPARASRPPNHDWRSDDLPARPYSERIQP